MDLPTRISIIANNNFSTEKNVKVRQSDNNQQSITSDTLLGLNSANMYPTYKQYQIVDPALNSNQEFRNVETLPEGTEYTEPEYQEVSSVPVESPQIKLENLQHAMLLQHPAPQQQQQTEVSRSSELRNFPDPRPSSATPQSPEADTSDNHGESRAATVSTLLPNDPSRIDGLNSSRNFNNLLPKVCRRFESKQRVSKFFEQP